MALFYNFNTKLTIYLRSVKYIKNHLAYVQSGCEFFIQLRV